MEKSTYQLRIDVDEKHYIGVSSLIELKPKNYDHGWLYEIILEEQPPGYDAIGKFLLSLGNKFELLEKFGVKQKDISIWVIYAYNGQCNMEFSPDILRRLGESGVALCISCYEAGYE